MDARSGGTRAAVIGGAIATVLFIGAALPALSSTGEPTAVAADSSLPTETTTSTTTTPGSTTTTPTTTVVAPTTTTSTTTLAPPTTVQQVADSDGDGVDDVIEDAAPSRFGGDVDFNQVADSLQPELASFPDPGLDAAGLGTDYISALAGAPGTLSVASPVAPASEPPAVIARTSVLDIRVVGLPTGGGPVVATLDLYAPIEANSFWAYDNVSDTWTDLTALASFDGVAYRTGPAQSFDTRVPVRWRTLLTIEDGGLGDADGSVDGVVSVFGVPAAVTMPPSTDDTDGDGVTDAIEDGAPNGGDLTLNRVREAEESYAASLPDPTLSTPSGPTYVAVDGYYLLDPATYPSGQYRATPLRYVTVTAPPSVPGTAGTGLVTGLISYVQTGLPLDGQPGANAFPDDPIPASPATAGTFVWLPVEPNSFWTYDQVTDSWTDATALINITPEYGIDPFDVAGTTYWGLEILIVDGGTGDADGTVNGEVLVVGAYGSTSTDADGVADLVEDAAPNGGDGNGDGALDSTQDNVTSLADPYSSSTTTNYVTISSDNSTSLRSVSTIDASTVEEPAPAGAGEAQSSLIEFTVDGLTVDTASPAVAIVDIHVAERANSYWKYDESAAPGSRWIDATSIATFATSPGADGRWKITLAIEDGGAFDFDGTVNGSVRDPGQARFVDVGATFELMSPKLETGSFYEGNAGRSIPIKWRIVDADGDPLPIETTGPPEVVSRSVACAAGEGTEVVDLVGSSFEEPIQMANGDWFFVWKTAKTWSGTCRSFEIAYPFIGLPPNVAEFVFS